ncbi:MAG TPA: 50S ribosomal protein L10, partial [Solirubrobacterales bacterium]
VVEDLAQRLSEAQAVFAIDYRGISVTQAAELRAKLREADAVFKVVKNRLAKRSAEQAGVEGLDEYLRGPIALTLIKGDPVTAAKAITTFSREHEVLEFRGGLMDGSPLDADGFKAIARLPGVDTLRGQLVGITASPLTGLVSGLNNLLAGLGRQLSQIAEKGLVTGEAPAEEAKAEEAPAEEAKDEAEAPAAEEAPKPEAEGSGDAEGGDGEEGEQPAEAAEDAQPEAEQAEAAEAEGSEEAPAAEETSEAPEATEQSDDNQESSDESAPEGEDSEDSDEATPQED